VEGGVLMEDLVYYALKQPLIDGVIHKLLVRPRLEEIFEYRRRKVEEIFGAAPTPPEEGLMAAR
jgi:ligand-binding SRPBCC domain-containing protein